MRFLQCFFLVLMQYFLILPNCLADNVSAPNNAHCFGPDVVSSFRTLDNSGRFFQYRFRWVRKAETGFPTVIYIPGGPGQTSMEDQLTQPKSVPLKYGLVLTDPRGVGCNYSSSLKAEDFQTKLLAQDILSIPTALQLKPNDIILYGASYGTLLATTTAYENQLRGRAPFRTLVLEGTIGKAFVGGEYFVQYSNAWEHYIQKKGEAFRSIVAESFAQNHLDPASFASFLNGYLLFGPWGNQGSMLDITLDLMTKDFPKFVSEYYTPTSEQPDDPNRAKAYRELWSQLWCREISSPGDGMQLRFESGRLVLHSALSNIGSKSCLGVKSDRLYDSAKLQVRERIIYLQGSQDPATSLKQARYHFDHQKKNPLNTFVIFKELGHGPSAVVQITKPGLMESIWLSDFNVDTIIPRFVGTPFDVQIITKH